jgi:putative ABC transport system permease protein
VFYDLAEAAMITRIRRAFTDLIRRQRAEQELDEELRTHLDRQVDQNMARGMNAEEAGYAAQRLFGGVQQVKDRCRDVRGLNFIESLFQDVRYALRQLRRNPGFTAVAVITLALGIGANTAIFSVVDALLIRPLPYADAGRLVWITDYFPSMHTTMVVDPDYAVWRSRNKVFCQLAAYGGGADYNLTGEGRPQRVEGWAVTANFLSTLGIQPALGRNFLPEEALPGGAMFQPRSRVAIISHRLWERLGWNVQILGKRLDLDGTPYTVIGVLPADFRFPAESQPDLIRPAGLSPKPLWNVHRPMLLVRVIGRLKAAVTIQDARSDLGVMNHWIWAQYPPAWRRMVAGLRIEVTPLHRKLVGTARGFLLILLGAVGLVLLICCVNVASLQLERTASRYREIAIRLAIGARRARVVRRLLTESMLIALCGSALALVIAFAGVHILRVLAPSQIPDPDAVSLDLRVLVFAFVLGAVSAVLFGLAPAAQAVKTDLSRALRDGGARNPASHRRLRGLLTVAEIALAVVLMAGAGLLVRSLILLIDVDPGFNANHLLTAQTDLPISEYLKPARQAAFLQEALGRVQVLPGVIGAEGGTSMPFSGLGPGTWVAIQGRPQPPLGVGPRAAVTSVSEGYFRTLQVPLVAGRFFTSRDAQGGRLTAIVNQAFVRLFFPGQNAIGQRVALGGPPSAWLTVVGVVGDIRYQSLDQPNEAVVYTPFLQDPSPYISIIVRTGPNPLTFAAALRAQVLAVDKNQPIFDVRTMEQRISETLGSRRFNMVLLTSFALLALALAAIGLYGVVSYSVSHRTHEIGIRMALGAQKHNVLRMVIGQGMILALAGIVLGICGTLGLTRLLSSLLYGVKPNDPLTFIAASLTLAIVAIVACYIPARRATKVDPAVALRRE